MNSKEINGNLILLSEKIDELLREQKEMRKDIIKIKIDLERVKVLSESSDEIIEQKVCSKVQNLKNMIMTNRWLIGALASAVGIPLGLIVDFILNHVWILI